MSSLSDAYCYGDDNRKRTHGHESGDLLPVLDELDAHALADGGIGLLRLDADLLEDDALCVRRSSRGRCFVEVAEGPLFIRFVRLQNIYSRNGKGKGDTTFTRSVRG